MEAEVDTPLGLVDELSGSLVSGVAYPLRVEVSGAREAAVGEGVGVVWLHFISNSHHQHVSNTYFFTQKHTWR